jgi:hypothetical protein
MPGACRLGIKANCPADGHGCTACIHNITDPGVQGSPDKLINNRPGGRQGDRGARGISRGPNTFAMADGAPTVAINCGGSGDVNIGNSQNAGFRKAAKNHAPFVCNCNQ